MYLNSFVVILMGFPCGSVAVQESWVQFLGWKDPLEKEMATHSNILAGKSHGQRSLEGYKELDMTKPPTVSAFFFRILV